MFENKNFNISEIYSVALIQPNKSEKKIKYDKKVLHYQLIYKLSGEVITHFNKKTVRITQGMAYIIPKCPDADYSIERVEVGDCIDIFFDTDFQFVSDLLCFDFSSDNEMKHLFQSAYKLWLSKTDGYYFKVMSVVYEILYMMILKNQKYIPNSKYKKIEKGVVYIREHLYDGNIDYNEPSRICGLSYTYFKKLFIEKFGVPPVRYVNDIRLERSRELLLATQYKVGEIARMCGFENTYYFSKRFKEKYHFAPTEYKKI